MVLLACTASSRMRWRTVWTSFSAPSVVCSMEDAVLRVALALLHATNLHAHLLRNGEAYRVIRSAVDPHAAGEFLEQAAEATVGTGEVPLRVERDDVGVDL